MMYHSSIIYIKMLILPLAQTAAQKCVSKGAAEARHVYPEVEGRQSAHRAVWTYSGGV